MHLRWADIPAELWAKDNDNWSSNNDGVCVTLHPKPMAVLSTVRFDCEPHLRRLALEWTQTPGMLLSLGGLDLKLSGFL